MEDKKKAAAAVAGMGAIGLAYFLATKAKAAPPPGAQASIGIEILDAQGNPVPHNSPATLVEGESYIARLTVTNRSTKAGQPWEATFEIVAHASTAYETLIPVTATQEYFGPGETRAFDYPFTVPLGTGGQSGQISGVVNDLTGVRLARAIEDFTITTVEIIYAAEIIVGVS